MVKALILALIALAASCDYSEAQSTRSAIDAYINSTFTANGHNAITGQQINTGLNGITASSGFLGDTNRWTGSNTFTGPFTMPGGAAATNLGFTPLAPALNLSDVSSPATARANLHVINFSPLDYGAKCDAATDDTTALKAMFTAISNGTSGNVTLAFPPSGMCAFSAALQVPAKNYVTINGNGGGLVWTGAAIVPGSSFTGSISKNVLTIISGVNPVVGDMLSDGGVNVPADSVFVASQVDGTHFKLTIPNQTVTPGGTVTTTREPLPVFVTPAVAMTGAPSGNSFNGKILNYALTVTSGVNPAVSDVVTGAGVPSGFVVQSVGGSAAVLAQSLTSTSSAGFVGTFLGDSLTYLSGTAPTVGDVVSGGSNVPANLYISGGSSPNFTLSPGLAVSSEAMTSVPPAVMIGTPGNVLKNYSIYDLRLRSNTVMTAGWGVEVNALAPASIINLDTGAGGSSNSNWWNGVLFAGGQNEHVVGLHARAANIAEGLTGQISSGNPLLDFSQDGQSLASASQIGILIGGACGGCTFDQTDAVQNSTNVRIDQSLASSHNKAIYFGKDMWVDGTTLANGWTPTGNGVGVGLEILDPGNWNGTGTAFNTSATWLSFAENQCFLIGPTVNWWNINMNGGSMVNCGQSGPLATGGFDNESTAPNLSVSFNGTNVYGVNGTAFYNISNAISVLLNGINYNGSTTSVSGSWTGIWYTNGTMYLNNSLSNIASQTGGANTNRMCAGSQASQSGLWVQNNLIEPGKCDGSSITAGVTALGSAAAYWSGAYSMGFISAGTKPTLTTGTCSAGTVAGGATAGTFVAPVCAAGTIILSGLPAAPTGWACFATDRTTTADTLIQTAATTTSATLRATTAANDVVQFHCTGY